MDLLSMWRVRMLLYNVLHGREAALIEICYSTFEGITLQYLTKVSIVSPIFPLLFPNFSSTVSSPTPFPKSDFRSTYLVFPLSLSQSESALRTNYDHGATTR